MPIQFAHVKRLEGLAHSMTQARDRKRRGLTLHADELPGLIEALEPAIATFDAARLAELADGDAIEDAAALLAESPTTAETPGVALDESFDRLVIAAREYVRIHS